MHYVGQIIEYKVPVEIRNIQTKAKQQKNDVVANIIKHQITNNKRKQQVTDKEKKKWKNQSIVIANSKVRAT